ncbi:MAG TPA: CzcE family metal-binding protein [Burkholderiales bacterium]|jgi:hypothetical protein|nr:CzcE family metal-binding protein [Burkholderiales bacterium]
MKSAHSVIVAALFGITSALTIVSVNAAEDAAATTAADIPDAPYTRWLYGFDGSRSPNGGRGLMAGASGSYGRPAGGMPYDHEISIQPDTRSVTVAHNETVKFVTPGGREFQWKFDTPRTVVPLARIAPPDVSLASNVAVFVTGDPYNDRG